MSTGKLLSSNDLTDVPIDILYKADNLERVCSFRLPIASSWFQRYHDQVSGIPSRIRGFYTFLWLQLSISTIQATCASLNRTGVTELLLKTQDFMPSASSSAASNLVSKQRTIDRYTTLWTYIECIAVVFLSNGGISTLMCLWSFCAAMGHYLMLSIRLFAGGMFLLAVTARLQPDS